MHLQEQRIPTGISELGRQPAPRAEWDTYAITFCNAYLQGASMARKYSKASSAKVAKAMHERKEGTLRSGGSGKRVKSRKQAIAIGLSEARREGKKVPKRKTAS